MEAKDRMTAEEFAAFAFMNVQTVRRKCRSGEIPAVKPGSRYVVLVDEYLAEQKKLRDARWAPRTLTSPIAARAAKEESRDRPS